ncbi:hypothetical protein IMCC26256_112089 [Actinobacteria bacterium IMCC26256]|nr:hypothetical protein IMCC26256_112089 [Actinobacteria bacterium IMCC26256]
MPVSAATVPVIVFFLFVFLLGVFMLGVRVAGARTADQFEGKTALVAATVPTIIFMLVAVFLLRRVEAIRIRREIILIER